MTKHIFGIICGILLCVAFTLPALAEELKINIGVESGEAKTKIVGADIYCLVDDQLAEITIRPDDQAFFANITGGALRLKAFWMTNSKTKKITK